MKQKGIIIATVVFFGLVNTTFLWNAKTGVAGVIVFLLLLIYFLVLTGHFLRQLLLAIKEKLTNRTRIGLLGVMFVVLGLTILFPKGLAESELFGSRNVLIARNEGTSHCTTTLKLKINNRFAEKINCDGVTKISGKYIQRGDTIYFEKIAQRAHIKDYYRFGVVTENPDLYYGYAYYLVRFRNYSDSVGTPIAIVKNKLKTR